MRGALSGLGIIPADDTVALYSRINAEMWKKLERGELTREQILVMRFELLFDELGVEVSAQKAKSLYEDLLGRGHYFVDGAENFLKKAYKKYSLYLVSNGTARGTGRTDTQRWHRRVFQKNFYFGRNRLRKTG